MAYYQIAQLILQGLREIEDRAKIKDILLSPDAVLQPNDIIIERDGRLLNNDERLVLSLVNGERPVQGIYDILDMPKDEITRNLYKLTNMSYIQIIPPN